MTPREFLEILLQATKTNEVSSAIEEFKSTDAVEEMPFGGRSNNRGAIEVASDAARSAIERVTNAHDALLELEHLRHGGRPDCRSPREAAAAWLGVPQKDGLSGLSPKLRQDLAQNTVVRLEPGEGWQSRILTITDRGVGISAIRLKDTILSLNESNKIQKHYLAGTYGQGGSSTLAFSKYVLFVSRAFGESTLAFTVAYYRDLPAEEYKTGRYVYLASEGDVFLLPATAKDADHGTMVRHFGYDLSNYTSAIGPRSLYGALQRIMFDPVASIRFENHVANWNRTIKGSRNALNGAVDQDDESSRGPDLAYNLPMFNLSLGDYGDIGIEYWVLRRAEAKGDKRPSAKPSRSFVDDARPIVLTHNGQNQGELSGRLIKKDADLPFLQAQGRLIVHVNCDRLSPSAKRLLFSSTREQSREGHVLNTIQDELVTLLKSDDELRRLNEEAREQSLKDSDDEAERQMQRQVAKLLRLAGGGFADVGGRKDEGTGGGGGGTYTPRKKPDPIDPKEPPTFIRIVGSKEDELTFYGGQRKYIRIETDANSSYHDSDDPKKSRINIILGDELRVFGTSPLRGGRLRIGVLCKSEVATGTRGGIRVELYRQGLAALSDEATYKIVEPPKPKDDERRSAFPQFKIIPVEGPEDEECWQYVTDDTADRDIKRHASGTEMSGGVLHIYYSLAYPRFASERARFEQQNPALAGSFQKRYELWLAVHALLVNEDERQSTGDLGEESIKEIERQERCRLAAIASMMASQEVKSGVNLEEAEEAG